MPLFLTPALWQVSKCYRSTPTKLRYVRNGDLCRVPPLLTWIGGSRQFPGRGEPGSIWSVAAVLSLF